MSTYETVAGTEPDPNVRHEPRTILDSRAGLTHMMTEIEDGVFVAWTSCARCTYGVATCACPGGPVLPPHIATWRDARFETSVRNRRPVVDLKPVQAAAQAAQDAAYGDSNDEEIDLLRGALDLALHALGLALPEGVDPDEDDDEEDDHPEHTECADGCGLAVTHQGRCLDKPGGKQVCEHPCINCGEEVVGPKDLDTGDGAVLVHESGAIYCNDDDSGSRAELDGDYGKDAGEPAPPKPDIRDDVGAGLTAALAALREAQQQRGTPDGQS